MAEEAKSKTYAARDNHEVLIPCMEGDFDADQDMGNPATREDIQTLGMSLAALHDDFVRFRDESLFNQNRVLKDLKTLIAKAAGYCQKQKGI